MKFEIIGAIPPPALNPTNLSRTIPIIEEIIRNSIDRSFSAGGRFGSGRGGGGRNRWKRSNRARSQSGQTLIDTGRMLDDVIQNIRIRISGKSLIVDLGADVQVNGKPLAAIHHFGAKIRRKNGKVTILPARPLFNIQEEDIKKIAQIIASRLYG